MEDKMQDDEFLGDTKQLLRPDEVFDAQTGYDIVRTLLIDKLRNIQAEAKCKPITKDGD